MSGPGTFQPRPARWTASEVVAVVQLVLVAGVAAFFLVTPPLPTPRSLQAEARRAEVEHRWTEAEGAWLALARMETHHDADVRDGLLGAAAAAASRGDLAASDAHRADLQRRLGVAAGDGSRRAGVTCALAARQVRVALDRYRLWRAGFGVAEPVLLLDLLEALLEGGLAPEAEQLAREEAAFVGDAIQADPVLAARARGLAHRSGAVAGALGAGFPSAEALR